MQNEYKARKLQQTLYNNMASIASFLNKFKSFI
jgi:hypothetical protein